MVVLKFFIGSLFRASLPNLFSFRGLADKNTKVNSSLEIISETLKKLWIDRGMGSLGGLSSGNSTPTLFLDDENI